MIKHEFITNYVSSPYKNKLFRIIIYFIFWKFINDIDDFRVIIEHSDIQYVRLHAINQLKILLGYKDVIIDEEKLINDIADRILSDTKCLDMTIWHCKTSHCLAGWACELNPIAKEIEQKEGLYKPTYIAGCIALPNYSHLFFKTDKEVLLTLNKLCGNHLKK